MVIHCPLAPITIHSSIGGTRRASGSTDIMVSFHSLVTFREDFEVKRGTIERITQGPLRAPQIPPKSPLRASPFCEKSGIYDCCRKAVQPLPKCHEEEDVGPEDRIEISVLEKSGSDTSDDEGCGSTSLSFVDRPNLPPLDIPSFAGQLLTPELPPQDTGWQAWKALIAATVVSSFSVGLCLAYGVFQNYYVQHFQLATDSQSAWIGVLSAGLPFTAAPLMTYLCQHCSLPRIHYVWFGWLMCVVALIGAAFCKTIPSLIITQGLLFGIGVTINDNPILIIVNTWFLHRRGMAYGILFASCDIMGVAWSFLANYLLHRYGLRTTFLVFAGIVAFGSGPCILLLKERGANSVFRRGSLSSRSKTPIEDVAFSAVAGNFDLIRRDTPPTRQRYFKRPIFYVLLAANLAQAFAFYLPLIYLPSYATDLGFNADKGAIVLAIANGAQVIGEIGFGKLSDKVNVHILVVISSTTAALATFFLWGLSKNLGVLLAYAFMFGMSGAGFIALWARMGILFGEQDAQMVFSFMCTGRGLGAIISGPISTRLLRATIDRGVYGNGRYEFMVVFVGTSMAVSAALGFLGAFTALGNVKNWLQRRTSVGRSPTMSRS